jgi:exopolyphosphatase/guanosine-5'-triphosphate,3'-diphosphate pyrophosphatase
MAKEIIPRWEWRTFSENFAELEGVFAALTPEGGQESDEIYILSSASDENAKVRDELMDIKALQQVNADALEQWKPVMKGRFPLPTADVLRVFDALAVECPTLSRSAYALQEFLEQLVKPVPELHVVQVHKKRSHYTVNGCMAEMTEVLADGKRVCTVALELEDPARVIATVRKLGLDRFPNINYPRGLKQLLGLKG